MLDDGCAVDTSSCSGADRQDRTAMRPSAHCAEYAVQRDRSRVIDGCAKSHEEP